MLNMIKLNAFPENIALNSGYAAVVNKRSISGIQSFNDLLL